MATHFSEYIELGTSTYLIDLVETAAATNMHVVGECDQSGLFVKTNNNGDLIWARSYTVDGHRVTFSTGLECSDGDFMLYGSLQVGPGRNDHIVVRVDASGEPRWAKGYHTETTRFDIRMVESGKETFYMIAWSEAKPKRDDIQIIKIDGNGNLLAAKLYGSVYDEQVNGMVAYDGGVILYGGTSQGTGWDGFVLCLDRDLKQVWGSMLGDKTFQDIKAVLPLGNNQFAVVGEATATRKTFCCTFSPTQASMGALAYDLAPNEFDGGIKQLIRSGDEYFLLGYPVNPTWAYITKLSSKFVPVWHKRLDIADPYALRDIHIHPGSNKTLRICGYAGASSHKGILIASDLDFATCLSVSLDLPAVEELQLTRSNWNPKNADITVLASELDVQVKQISGQVEKTCTLVLSKLTASELVQSPYIYLQAAGSTGVDDSVFGVHLRWMFQRSLGDKHLAKGHLSGLAGPYPSTLNFNRDDDFVKIYRGPFHNEFWTEVDLTVLPSMLVESGLVRAWTYMNLIPIPSLPSELNTVELRFTSVAQYDVLRSSIDPSIFPHDFIAAYTGVIEVKVQDKLSFRARLIMAEKDPSTPSGSGFVRLEALSLPDALDPDSLTLSCRKEWLNISSANTIEVTCENIQHIRFSYGDNLVPIQIRLLAYRDYLLGVENDYPGDWTLLNDFSLELADTVIESRLEDTTLFQVHNTWRKFNEPDSSGEFKVNLDNYRTRWAMTNGLREGVIEYLSRSITDPSATAIIPNSDPIANNSQMEVSYLNLLNIVSLDFHVARMLGLGTIDPQPNTLPFMPLPTHVYLMTYETYASLEGEPPGHINHLYMTPPIKATHHKLPPAPSLKPVSYGLFGNNLTGNPTPLTDPNGYLPFGDVRYINLHKDLFRHQRPLESFFETNELFCLCDQTLPVCFGVEYAAGTVGTGTWVRPELEYDPDFMDPGGLPEVVPLAETGSDPIYVHLETNPGIHHYAMYSINWFSRISPMSNQVETDTTAFPLRCPLLPPLNVQVQLIQPEQPLIFTTGAEQTSLGSLVGTDKTLLRVTFDWNHVHNMAYQFADKAKFYFNTEPPLVVKGAIAIGPGAIVVDPMLHLVTIQTVSYTITSTSPAQTVAPVIPLADKPRFIGGSLVANGVAFVIEDIYTTVLGTNPEFVLRQIRETHNQESPANSNIWYTTETWVSPAEGERFFLTENLTSASIWDQVMTKEVTLVNFLPTHTETIVNADGSTTLKTIGGLTDSATVTHRYDLSVGAPPFTPTGAYDILFDTQNLVNHPDPDVDFHGGIVRVASVAGEMKDLQVWVIDNSGTTLLLTVYDPTFGSDPIIPVTPPAQTGVVVNFHPSYRAYFIEDGGFNEANTLPGLDEGTRMTFLYAASSDSSTGCNSHLSPPAVIIARELREPVPPGVPQGPLFATRPNFYGKSTYTFDVQVDAPYSLVFFRANDRKILDQLYKPETVSAIYAQLDKISDVDLRFVPTWWHDLVHVQTDIDDMFIEHIFNGFRFPIPDNEDYTIPHPNPSVIVHPFVGGTVPPGSATLVGSTGMTMREVVAQAIEGAFLPLTELPLVYGQLTGTTLQTSDRKPKLRNANGERLVYGVDIDYDPWPMAVKFEKDTAGNFLRDGDAGYGNPSNEHHVRFTDYTLDGASKNIYFYFGVEMSNTLKVSERSPITGPVQLINSAAPAAPVIRQVRALVQDPFAGTVPSVEISVNPYLAAEEILYLKLYRATTAADAVSVRSMVEVMQVEAGAPLLDTFSDLGFAPYTDPLFYRVVAYRRLINEQGDYEIIPSQASKPVLTNVVDNTNPEQPNLRWDSDALTPSHPLTYPNVKLIWETVVYKGTYHLYKLDDRGTWVRIYSTQNAGAEIQVTLGATTYGSSSLVKEDDNGNTCYHLFRVQVENSSGLISKAEKALRI